jgi:hypothetical protein
LEHARKMEQSLTTNNQLHLNTYHMSHTLSWLDIF